MRQEKFSLENLRMLDMGVIGKAFDVEVARVMQDCMDRPLDDKARQVAIVFNITPKPDTSNVGSGAAIDCEHVSVECDITSKVPPRRTKVYEMTPRHDGSAVFHPDEPSDADANLMFDEQAERDDKTR